MLSWLSSLRGKPSRIEKRHEPKTEYLGEKTGPVEDDLKKSLVPVFEQYPDVHRAYLAIISNDGRKSWSVGLCLAPRKVDERLVREVGTLFHSMFGKDQFLDMMFLGEEAELEIQKACSAFYSKNEPNQPLQPTRFARG